MTVSCRHDNLLINPPPGTAREYLILLCSYASGLFQIRTLRRHRTKPGAKHALGLTTRRQDLTTTVVYPTAQRALIIVVTCTNLINNNNRLEGYGRKKHDIFGTENRVGHTPPHRRIPAWPNTKCDMLHLQIAIPRRT